jgi:hypothetical protein
MDAAQVKAVFARMKTSFPNSIKTMAYNGRSASGIVTNAAFPADLSSSGNEQGVRRERISLDVSDADRPANGDEIIIDGAPCVCDGANLDPTGALFFVDYHFQKPVVINPQEIG